MDDTDALKYPIGKYSWPDTIDQGVIKDWIHDISQLPSDLRTITVGLNDNDLNKSYRPGGWNIRQLVHHIGDSHANSLIRFKWALTEENPTIKAYYEERWAELGDSTTAPIDLSIDFIESLHKRWVYLLNSMEDSDWDKTFVHPETGRQITLKWNLGLYAWHGNHHLAHIRQALHS